MSVQSVESKLPAEVYRITLDVKKLVGIVVNATVVAAVSSGVGDVNLGTMVSGVTHIGTRIQCLVANGLSGNVYRIRFTFTDDKGQTLIEDVLLPVT